MGKLFGCTNPNERIFEIERQEGSDILEGDDGVASIGDATLQHVEKLSDLEREAYHHYIKMADGNLFDIVENRRWDEVNEASDANEEDLDKSIKSREEKVDTLFAKLEDENLLPSLRTQYLRDMEALEEELDFLRSRKDGDLLGHPEQTIPYQQWSQFPQMSKHWDIPATPRPRPHFAGTTRQVFYDEMPTGHPLFREISTILSILDKFPVNCILTPAQMREHNETAKNKIERAGFTKSKMKEFTRAGFIAWKDTVLVTIDGKEKRVPKDGIQPGVATEREIKPSSTPAYLYTDGDEDYLVTTEFSKTIRKMIMSREQVDFPIRELVLNALLELVEQIAVGKSEATDIYVEKMNPQTEEIDIVKRQVNLLLSPFDLAVRALRKIDQQWTTDYRKACKRRTIEEDPLSVYLIKAGRNIIEKAKSGENVESEINRLSQRLYKDGLITEKKIVKDNGQVERKIVVERMRPGHWLMLKGRKNKDLGTTYNRKLKDHKGRIVTIADNVDGSGSIRELCAYYMSLYHNRTESPALHDTIERMMKVKDQAIEKKSFRLFTTIPAALIKGQNSGKIKLSAEEWKKVWFMYNTMKADLSKTLSIRSST